MKTINQLLEEINKMVNSIQDPNTDIDKSIEMFTKTQALIKEAEKRLNEAREQVVKIIEEKNK